MDDPVGTMLEGMDVAVTMCDCDFNIVWMNGKAASTFAADGGKELVGKSLLPCHKSESAEKMRAILATGKPNVYTISKKGVRKLIWQGPWIRDGEKAGLVEISIVLPEDIPHFRRD